MFEIRDERIGHLKIFNVTEARANFADVLKENNAKVVVTRHGRPTKILISYEEYLSLLATAGDETSQRLTQQVASVLSAENPAESTDPSPAPRALPPKWVQRESEQIVHSLRGLLK